MKKQKKGILRIGTSNIALPGNRQSFPPAFRDKSRLHYYGTLFNSLEVNSSFYKVPKPSTFEKWTLEVPEDFKFTVKLWKEITHVKNLEFNPEDIGMFLAAADKLGNKKGCLLIQFPGKITLDYFHKVEQILDEVQQHNQGEPWKTAVEFRNSSWYSGETFELLDEYAATMVMHDIPKGKNIELNKTADFVFIRFHGPAGDYRGSYSNDFLIEKATLIKGWLNKGKDVYAYFNNTIGSAFENARTLQSMIESWDRPLKK